MRLVTSLVPLLAGVSLAYPGGYNHHLVRSAAEGCTENSQSLSYWYIDDFRLTVYNWDNGGTTGNFGFRSYYSATNTTVNCMLQGVDLAKLEDSWSKCSGNATGTEFRFDLSDVSLTIKETWTCPGSPATVFTANATGSIMMHGCLDSDSENGVESECNLMELELAANTTLLSAQM